LQHRNALTLYRKINSQMLQVSNAAPQTVTIKVVICDTQGKPKKRRFLKLVDLLQAA